MNGAGPGHRHAKEIMEEVPVRQPARAGEPHGAALDSSSAPASTAVSAKAIS